MHTGGKIDAPKREMIEKLTAEVIRFWRAEENGIWEVMDKRPFTYGKIMCWVALERARELRGDKDGAIAEACAAIKAEIMERGIVDHSGQKILSSEMDKMELDASSLLAFTTGFLPEYLAKSTREAIEQELLTRSVPAPQQRDPRGRVIFALQLLLDQSPHPRGAPGARRGVVDAGDRQAQPARLALGGNQP
jgi:GH15 family glucan-1,4-alpha-glucosidase